MKTFVVAAALAITALGSLPLVAGGSHPAEGSDGARMQQAAPGQID